MRIPSASSGVTRAVLSYSSRTTLIAYRVSYHSYRKLEDLVVLVPASTRAAGPQRYRGGVRGGQSVATLGRGTRAREALAEATGRALCVVTYPTPGISSSIVGTAYRSTTVTAPNGTPAGLVWGAAL